MNSISIKWERRAVKEISALPRKDQQRVLDAVADLRSDPLQGRTLSGKWKGFRRLRTGGYRVVYAFDGRELLILAVRAHRGEVYR